MKKVFSRTILAFTAILFVGSILNVMSAFAQMGNDTMTTNATLAYGQMGNDTMTTNATLAYGQMGNDTMTTEEHSEEADGGVGTTVRDSVTVLLQDMIIPAGDFIHLYDTTPNEITNGHVAVKLPCYDNSDSPIDVLIGVAPDLAPAELENVANLSDPGNQCLYHADLAPSENVTAITDIAISNPLDEDIELPTTSSVVIGINEMVIKEHEEHEAEEGQEAQGT